MKEKFIVRDTEAVFGIREDGLIGGPSKFYFLLKGLMEECGCEVDSHGRCEGGRFRNKLKIDNWKELLAKLEERGWVLEKVKSFRRLMG